MRFFSKGDMYNGTEGVLDKFSVYWVIGLDTQTQQQSTQKKLIN